MKSLFSGLALAACLAVATSATAEPAAKPLNLADGVDALTALRKIQCSTKDAQPVIYHWSGRAYSRVPGEPDRHLFDVEGMNVRQCVAVSDPVRGRGFRMVSRELMFYLDPASGQVLKTWNNPWTGKSVEVVHVANDPVNMAPAFPFDAQGKPFALNARVEGGRVFMPIEAPLFYRNPLAGDYQAYVGNQYHAMEIFDFVADEAELVDRSTTQAHASVSWVRVAEWLPWMEMGGRVGLMVVNATGQAVPDVSALPAVLRTEIQARYPQFAVPPPLDDTRPNETSWSHFKKIIDARKAAEAAR